jgi:hypothetical protein
MATNDPTGGASIAELLKRLANDTALLVRQEIDLVRAELAQKARAATRPAILITAGVIFAIGAFAAVTATLIALIALAVPVWAAAVIVSTIYATIAALTVRSGIEGLKHLGNPVPEKAIASIREDVAAVQVGVKRGL